MSQEDDAGRSSEERSGAGGIRLLLGRVASVLGILVAISIAFTPNIALTAAVSAIALGGAGYVLGARRLGIAAVIIAVLALIFGLMAISGSIPGFDPPGPSEQSPER